MLRKIALAAVIAAALNVSALAQKPTKTAPPNALTWQYGLSDKDVNRVDRVTRNLSDRDRYMVWTAIVRNREAAQDIYRGEPLTNAKVLANVRVRMSTQESQMWTSTWAHLNSYDRDSLIRVLSDDLATKR